MRIVRVVDRELTSGEIESMHRFATYFDNNEDLTLVCLREGVMVVFYDETNDINVLMEKARNKMAQALSAHPDMNSYDMDDGHTLIALPHGDIFAATSESDDSHNSFTSYMLRAECLEACECGEIIAIAFREED